MKKYVFLFSIVAAIAACSSADKKAPAGDTTQSMVSKTGETSAITPDTANLTTMQWLDSTYLDLGQSKEDKEIEVSFRFKNSGNHNLVIQNVTAGCGCTIPEKPQQPFAPGEEGVIKAKFNGKGHGETRKEIYVTANTTPANYTLTFRADLVSK